MTFDTLAGPLGALLIGYLLGSIPFGVVLTRTTGAGGARQQDPERDRAEEISDQQGSERPRQSVESHALPPEKRN